MKRKKNNDNNKKKNSVDTAPKRIKILAFQATVSFKSSLFIVALNSRCFNERSFLLILTYSFLN